MKTPWSVAVALPLVWLGMSVVPFAARGTDDYEYKPGETLVIDHGLSPDKQFAIAAGVSAKNGESNFHLYLQDAKTHKRIGPLEEATDALDTGAGAIHAAWAPDSRHVAITYRIDRHQIQMLLYRIENRRAYVVTGSTDLIGAVKGGKKIDATHLTAFYQEPKWESATRLSVHQESHYRQVESDPKSVLGAYAQVDADDGSDDKTPDGKKTYTFGFYADGVCEVADGDKCRVVSVKPGKSKF